MFHPFSMELQGALKSFSKGNFSLWFNKLVPLNNAVKCKACDRKGDDKEVVAYYKSEYDGMKKNSTLKNLLAQKHADQARFCENYRKSNCEAVIFSAELRTPLITGIGQTHPNEVGMVFDHTMGIPYIPASTIKGIVRLAHTIGLINSEGCEEYINGDDLDESNRKTMIPDLFGGDLVERTNGKPTTKKLKGEVVFLDAYPAKVPDLHTDIMNPHYGAYYSDPDGKISPADHLEPNPIKFLTVSPGTTFIFRALVPKNSGLKQHVINAYETAFTIEGIGAKTAVGYGRFNINIAGKDDNGLTGKKPSIPVTKTQMERHQEEERHKEEEAVKKQHIETMPPREQKMPKKETWHDAHLRWTPNDGVITASWEGQRATTMDRGLVPDQIRGKLFGKKKNAAAKEAVVEPIGNAWKIISIH